VAQYLTNSTEITVNVLTVTTTTIDYTITAHTNITTDLVEDFISASRTDWTNQDKPSNSTLDSKTSCGDNAIIKSQHFIF
jgi:hypothetical protein